MNQNTNNSTRCSTCNNYGHYSVMQYEKQPNGVSKERGYKTFQCYNCQLMNAGLHIIQIIQTRVKMVENPDIRLELERLLQSIPNKQSGDSV